MRLYISGPMTGYEDHNFPAFFAAEKALKEAGYEVSNPAQYPVVDGETWESCLKRDIKDLVDCDGIALLDGWTASRGAVLEAEIAARVKLPLWHVDMWLESAKEWAV